jgi:hypothetical protein
MKKATTGKWNPRSDGYMKSSGTKVPEKSFKGDLRSHGTRQVCNEDAVQAQGERKLMKG